jgi:DNA-binding NarL/FixJ family response regulator
VTENDGEFTLGVIESIKITRGQSRKRGDESKSERDYGISQRHIRVILEYAAGKDLAEIAREEKSSRGTILRILRTAPFTLLEIPGIIGPT